MRPHFLLTREAILECAEEEEKTMYWSHWQRTGQTLIFFSITATFISHFKKEFWTLIMEKGTALPLSFIIMLPFYSALEINDIITILNQFKLTLMLGR